jgi:hypothetical protein
MLASLLDRRLGPNCEEPLGRYELAHVCKPRERDSPTRCDDSEDNLTGR